MITGKNANILIADDSSHYAGLLGSLLVEAGYKVSCTHDKDNIKTAISAASHDLSLLVLDINMPGINETTILEWLHENNHTKHFPVICLTDIDYNELDSHYLKAKYGVAAVLKKNITAEKFLSAVNDALCYEKQRILRQDRAYRALPVKFMLGTAFHDGVLLNMSVGGAFLHTDLKLNPQNRLRLSFKILGENSDAAKSMMPLGVVRWTTPRENCKSRFSGVGIQFTQLAPSEERTIKEFMGAA